MLSSDIHTWQTDLIVLFRQSWHVPPAPGQVMRPHNRFHQVRWAPYSRLVLFIRMQWGADLEHQQCSLASTAGCQPSRRG